MPGEQLTYDVQKTIMPNAIMAFPVKDTGFEANSSSGDKTAVITDYVNGVNETMITALNVVSAGTGTAVSAACDMIVLLRKKVQALEATLAAGKLPNL